VGETDRVVHVFPIPTGRTIPDELRAFSYTTTLA
jgi:hypothetical protein